MYSHLLIGVLSCLYGNEKACSIYKTDESRLRRFTGGAIWSRIEECVHQQVEILSNKKLVSIKRNQFLQSFIDNLSARLCPAESDTNDTFLKDLELFDELGVTTIPTSDLENDKVRRLAMRFRLDEKICLRGMRAYNDDDKCNKDIVPQKKAIDTILCSSAECERGFSEMANILTDQRSNLTLENVKI